MEVIKFDDIKTKELSRTLLTTGYTAKIDCTRYWDAHGERSEWEPEQHKFDKPKKFEIVKVLTEWDFEYLGPSVFEDWLLYIDGKKYNIDGEIMKYHVLKTKLKLDVCVGHG